MANHSCYFTPLLMLLHHFFNICFSNKKWHEQFLIIKDMYLKRMNTLYMLYASLQKNHLSKSHTVTVVLTPSLRRKFKESSIFWDQVYQNVPKVITLICSFKVIYRSKTEFPVSSIWDIINHKLSSKLIWNTCYFKKYVVLVIFSLGGTRLNNFFNLL